MFSSQITLNSLDVSAKQLSLVKDLLQRTNFHDHAITIINLINCLIAAFEKAENQELKVNCLVEIETLINTQFDQLDSRVQSETLVNSLNKSEILLESPSLNILSTINKLSVLSPSILIIFFGTSKYSLIRQFSTEINKGIQLRKSFELCFNYVNSHKFTLANLRPPQIVTILFNTLEFITNNKLIVSQIMGIPLINFLTNLLSKIDLDVIFPEIDNRKLQTDEDVNMLGHEDNTTRDKGNNLDFRIKKGLVFLNQEESILIKNMFSQELHKYIISSCLINDVSANHDTLDTSIITSFYFSLINFINLKSVKNGNANTQNSVLKSNLIVNLIVISSNYNFMYQWFVTLTENDFYNEILIQLDEKNYKFASSDPLFKMVLSKENEDWWKTLFIFNELYSYIIYVCRDKDLFTKGKLNGSDFISFTSFLKNLSIFTVLLGRTAMSLELDKNNRKSKSSHIEGNENIYFKIVGLQSIKLLKQIYLRDLRLHHFESDFWQFKNVQFDLRNFAWLYPILADDKNWESEDDNISSLENNRMDVDLTEPKFSKNRFDIFSPDLPQIFRKIGIPSNYEIILLLSYLPFLIPFEARAEIFRNLINFTKGAYIDEFRNKKVEGTVNRSNVLLEGYSQFGKLSGELFRYPLLVQFVNEFGAEAGIDGGGLTKEFLTSSLNIAFDTSKDKGIPVRYIKDSDEENDIPYDDKLVLFDQTSKYYQIYPSSNFFWKNKLQDQVDKLLVKLPPNIEDVSSPMSNYFELDFFRYIGMLIGKCLFENVLIDASFAHFFLSKWTNSETILGEKVEENQQYKNSFDDLKLYDGELYSNLSKLLEMPDDQLKLLELNFTLTESISIPQRNGDSMSVESFKIPVTVDLIPGGSDVYVDASNKLQYVYTIARFKMDFSLAAQTKYILEGIYSIISPRYLSLFNPFELGTLVSGGEKSIDIQDLKRHTVLGGYSGHDQTVKDLFDILENVFTDEEKCKFIKFVTAAPKAPLFGFKELNPKFGIRNAGPNKDRLPTASTCINLLKLPDYCDKELLKQKLLYSINSESGFDLS
ncbi:hypothetical protein B5S33_g640 [[Candida] boidinii]|nr:hypothetical protein B5S30_g33 [[Candida] boidinii]OWB82019.1 hypothetical protein B5S33_g640 [[Candida] boidinii]